MATFTITIANQMDVLGMGDPSLWNTMVWGTDDWGSADDVRIGFFKNLASESVAMADALSKKPILSLGFGTIAVASTMSTFCHFDGYLNFKYVRAGDFGVDGFGKTADGSSGWSKTSDGTDDWS